MPKSMNVSARPATVDREEWAAGVSVLRVEGALRAPVRKDLRKRVKALLDQGRRTILLDLAKVTDLDAAGVGELVRVYTLTDAAESDLWIQNSSAKTCRLLDRAGLFEVLTIPSLFAYEQCS